MPDFGLELRKKELRAYLRARKLPEVTRYALLSHYRSGSTLLSRLLDSHPDVSCAGEVLVPFLHIEPKLVPFIESFLRFHARNTDAPIGGVVVRIDQLRVLRVPGFHPAPADRIARMARDGWRFIHLVRENTFNQALSNVEANIRGLWHVQKGETHPDDRLVIPVDRLLKGIRWAERIRKAEDAALQGISHHEVFYERDLLEVDRRQRTMNQLFDFLGAGPHEVETTLRKVGRRSLRDRIENVEEVVAAVREGGYGHHLPDDVE